MLLALSGCGQAVMTGGLLICPVFVNCRNRYVKPTLRISGSKLSTSAASVSRLMTMFVIRSAGRDLAWLFDVAEEITRTVLDGRRSPDDLPYPVRLTGTGATLTLIDERVARMRTAFEVLPPGEREILRLHRIEERDLAHMAGVLDCSQGEAFRTYCVALRSLARALRDHD